MELAAISMDSKQGAVQMVFFIGAEFQVLADPDGKAVRDYGVYDLLGDGLAAPATFILDGDGTVLWRHVGRDISDRPTPQQVLDRLEELVGS